MSLSFQKEEIVRKIKAAVSLGLLAGVLFGWIRAALFVIGDQYTAVELQTLWPGLLVEQLNGVLLVIVPASAAFAVLWGFFDKTANLGLAFLLVLLPFVPLAYFMNKHFLPGIREPQSLAGNGILALLFAAGVWLAFTRFTREWRLQGSALKPPVIVFVVIVIVGVYGIYFLQPAYARLSPSSRQADTAFFDLLALDADSLATIRDAIRRGDFKTARTGLLEHLRKRSHKHSHRVFQDMDSSDSALVIPRADSIAQRSFTFWGVSRQLSARIDWRTNPTDDRVWLFTLNQQQWLAHVAAAYVLTGDEKYARDYALIMDSWLKQNTLPSWKNEEHPVWRLMETAIRSSNWLKAFFVFLSSESVSPEIKIKVLAALHDHAQFLHRFRSPQRNHLLRESYGLLEIAALLPEFKMAPAWEKMAVARLARAVEQDVYPDGGYSEGSTYYHRFAIRVLQEIKNFAEENSVALPGVISQRLEGMYDYLLYLSRPDGTMPPINDGFHARDLRDLFARPAMEFRRKDFAYFSSGGLIGEKPSHTSRGFPYSGIYVMRSDWTSAALYCILDAGLFGSAHGHEDKLSFELHAFGRPFLIEAGTYTYVYDQWHKYFESSHAHNTVVVDGKSQFRQAVPAKWVNTALERLPNQWASTPDFDYFEASYDDGYGKRKESLDRSIRHTRRMLFIKPDYWILWDVLSGRGRHQYEQLFHFAPMQVIVDGSTVRTENNGGAGLVVYSLLPENASIKMVEGQTDPIQGWVSPIYGQKKLAPVVIYSQIKEAPAVFLSALVPMADAKPHALSATVMPVSIGNELVTDDRAVAVHIKTAEWSDEILLAPRQDGQKRFGELVTTRQLLFRRVGNSGNTIKQFESELPARESD